MQFNNVITISGVHGVGKSTLISQLISKFDFRQGVHRPLNPFQSTYEAMLFFISAFSFRDKMLHEDHLPNIIDRWAYIDISVYIESLSQLKYISKNESKALLLSLENSYCKRLTPKLAILLDDDPTNILERIQKYRIPSKHHIHERDVNFIEKLRENFLKAFSSIEQKNCKSNVKCCKIISVHKKPPEDISRELLEYLKKLSFSEIY